jgi:hypothetical protein
VLWPKFYQPHALNLAPPIAIEPYEVAQRLSPYLPIGARYAGGGTHAGALVLEGATVGGVTKMIPRASSARPERYAQVR